MSSSAAAAIGPPLWAYTQADLDEMAEAEKEAQCAENNGDPRAHLYWRSFEMTVEHIDHRITRERTRRILFSARNGDAGNGDAGNGDAGNGDQS